MLNHGKDGTVAAATASPDWQVIPVPTGSPGARCRLNLAFRRARDRTAYPVRVVALVRVGYVNSVGSPVLPPAGAVAAIEAAGTGTVTGEAAPGAVLVATITTLTSVEFVLYATSKLQAAVAEQALRAGLTDHRVTAETTDDPRWRGYRRLAREKRRNRAGRVLLALFPLLAGAMVYAHYGPWWGLGEVIACAAWVALFLFPSRAAPASSRRGRVARLIESSSFHLGWLFVIFAGAFASLFFGIIALLAGSYLPAVACLAIAVAAGLLLTAALWPAQRRFTAMMRSRRPAAGHDGPAAAG
jgi:hypothetical protein